MGMISLPFSHLVKTIERQQVKQNPKTIGEHLRVKRLQGHLTQKEVAQLIGVSEDCITFWEKGRSIPQVQYYPAIIQFLDYFPFEIDINIIGGRIKRYRYEHGLSFKKLAKLTGFDPATLARWEESKTLPSSQNLKKLKELI